MKPYSVEIFRPDFTMVGNTNVNEVTYKEDYLTSDENTITVLALPGIEKQDFIRISRGSEEYAGVVTEIGYGTDRSKRLQTISYKPLVELLNTGILFDVNAQGQGTLEEFICDRIRETFIENPDTLQNIHGLSVAHTSATTDWSLHITPAESGGHYNIVNLWHSTDRYRRVIYRCNRKYKGKRCETSHVTEDEVKVAFVSAYNQIVSEKAEIIANAQIIRQTLCRTDVLEEEKHTLEDEMSVVVEMAQSIIAENARIAQNQDEYQKRYDALMERYDAAKARHGEMVGAITAKVAQSERLSNFIEAMQVQEGILTEFDERLWSSMVDFVTVGRKKEITITFRDGTKITA